MDYAPLENLHEAVSNFQQITELFQQDYAELKELHETGHSFRSTIKELYKLLLIGLIKQTLPDLNNIQTHSDILGYLYSLDELQKQLVLAQVNTKLQYWQNGDFDDGMWQLKSELLQYFQTRQITTQIGEKGIFALEKLGFNEQEIQTAQELSTDGAVRQRIFNYQIGPEDLPNLINSAYNYAQITGHSRELIEARNLEKLYEIFAQIEIGDCIVERSLPVHRWQHDCMWRIFRKTFRLKSNGSPGELEECWDITVLSLPPDPTQVSIYPELISAACTQMPVSVIASCEEQDPLAQMIYIPGHNGLDVTEIANQIPTVSNLGGFTNLQAMDLHVASKVQEITTRISPVTEHILNVLPQITNQDQLTNLTSLYQQCISAVILEQLPDTKLQQLSQVARELIKSGELLELVSSGELDLNEYIAQNCEIGYLELESECGIAIVGQLADTIYEQDIDHTQAPQITEKNGVELTWLKTNDGRSILAKCPNPNCNQKYLDPCLSHCPTCGISTGEMRTAYENGTFHSFIDRYNSINGMRTKPPSRKIDDLFNSIFSGITGLFSWIFA